MLGSETERGHRRVDLPYATAQKHDDGLRVVQDAHLGNPPHITVLVEADSTLFLFRE